jgi:PAS domain S-box-containing protein
MPFKDAPIQRKLMTIIMLTCGAVLVLMCAAFFTYEFLTFRQTTARHLSTLGEIIAANSTAALAFQNQEDAQEVLSALKAERHIVAAALYDQNGKLFVKYPDNLSVDAFPVLPEANGSRFGRASLITFQPVVQGGNKRLGTLYLKSDLGAMYERLRLYSMIALLLIAVSLLVAYLLSRMLQRQISRPILALAETARAVSDHRDYSVRVTKSGADELGLLTDAFNHMLTRIQEQDQALRGSEARVRAVLDSAISAVLVIDEAGTITDWNARAEAMFGWTRDEVLGLVLADLVIPVRYREQHQHGMKHFLVSGEGPVLNQLIELSALRRDGSEFPVELSISPLRTDEVVTFCGFVTDITARRQSDQKLQAQLARLELLNQITRAIPQRQDLQSIFQVVIHSLEKNLQIDCCFICLYEPADNAFIVTTGGCNALTSALIIPEHLSIPVDQNGFSRCTAGEMIYEPDISKMDFLFLQRLAAGGLSALVLAPLLVDNTIFGVLVAARREPQSFSSPDCEFLKQLSDHVALAAHQAQIYGKLQQAYDDLRQTQDAVMQQERLRSLGQMASGIAHDINNAISPIALYTESLLENEPNLSSRTRNYLEIIERSIDDVAATVARMREFYRPREPQMTLTHVRLNDLVQQVVDLTRARWSDMPQHRGVAIRMRTELAPDLPNVMGVESEIREALTNLIFNAVDGMPEGGILTLRTLVSDGRPDGTSTLRQVYLEVADSGVGMDEDTKRRCLEPFFTTKGERGTGLGLAMVYGMVQRHSAELQIVSAPGQGTTVCLGFSLPVAAFITSFQPPLAPAPQSLLRILIVDDDPLLAKTLLETLEADGHWVLSAEGGQMGIDVLSAELERGATFDVVITDLGMPYVDGRQVASAVKHKSPSTAVILFTGWGQRLVDDGDIPPHVDLVLSKPPKLRQLREALTSVCQPNDS